MKNKLYDKNNKNKKVIQVNFRGIEREFKQDHEINECITGFNKLYKSLNNLYYSSISLDIEDEVYLTVYVIHKNDIKEAQEEIIHKVKELKELNKESKLNVYICHESLQGELTESSISINTNLGKTGYKKIIRVYKGISFYGKRVNPDSYIEFDTGINTEEDRKSVV